MNPGDKTHQLIIQVPTLTQNDEGVSTITWTDWQTVWAQPLKKEGREYFKLSNNNSEITEIFRIDYIGKVSPHHRIKFKCQYYEIISVINEGERNVELLLTCKAVV